MLGAKTAYLETECLEWSSPELSSAHTPPRQLSGAGVSASALGDLPPFLLSDPLEHHATLQEIYRRNIIS